MSRILITGAAGFVGSWLCREFSCDHEVIAMVRSESCSLLRLQDIQHQIQIIAHNISQPWPDLGPVDVILHAGGDASSESCIKDPLGAVDSNVRATVNALEFARPSGVGHFVYYSSGEVFGPVPPGMSSGEDDVYACGTPYAATKAAGAELVRSYYHCHGLRASVIHINNTFGAWSQPNRFPAIAARAILKNQPLTVHRDPLGNIARRRWFSVSDVASHTRWILTHQVQGFECWNSAGARSIDNLEFAQIMAQIAGRDLEYQVQESSRPGHTVCYDIDPKKIYESGWRGTQSLEQHLANTLEWYQHNPEWLERT